MGFGGYELGLLLFKFVFDVVMVFECEYYGYIWKDIYMDGNIFRE